MSIKITASKMHNLEHNLYLVGEQNCTLNTESEDLLNALLKTLSALQYRGDNERWVFCVLAPREEK